MTTTPEDHWFLDADERALVADALAIVQRLRPDQHAVLEAMLGRLRRTADLVRDSPGLASSWDGVVGRTFSSESLVEQLCRVPDYDLDLHIPTKAVLGQAYLVAKINVLKALGYTLESLRADASLVVRVDREIAQSIYTKLAEELFVAIVTDADGAQPVRAGAARFLFRIWEDRLLIEVDDFAPVLESAWEARAKLLPVLGTMLGTHEVFRLYQEARDPRLFEHFALDDVDDEQLLAFEEFLFGLSHEEIVRLRTHMLDAGHACLSLEAARTLLGDTRSSWLPPNAAQALYSSYKKRRVNAAHRALTGAPGPKKTAEEYVMIAFLASAASER